MLSWLFPAILLSVWLMPPFMGALLAQTLAPMIIIAVTYAMIIASVASYILTKSPSVAERPAEPVVFLRRWLKRLACGWGLVLLSAQIAILARIMMEESSSSSSRLQDIARTLFAMLSPWIPALRDLPSEMARHGFIQRADIVTDSYAFAYVAAVINICAAFIVIATLTLRFLWRGGFAAIPHGFNNVPGYKQLFGLLGWPFIVLLYVYFIFIDTGVKVVAGRRENFAHFETGNIDLYFRTLCGTGFMTVGACALTGTSIFLIGLAVTGRLRRVPEPA
jgi:hypothetical protein